jgi:pimeloyl-ACP methyl ester carboxylesterase
LVWIPTQIDPGDQLVVYIEGDGLAYIADDRPSSDPTPLSPMALQLALAQPDGNRAVLDRPCQYLKEGAHCAERYWTTARFSPEVIGAMSAALDGLRERFRAQRLILVGYSGGASVAALLALRRTDVVGLVTVAGNLDHRAWTAWHRVSPLTGSLDPVDDVSALQRVPQIHLAGEKDRIVPPELLEEFAVRVLGAKVQILKGYDHHCCWAENWPAIWRSIAWDPPADR